MNPREDFLVRVFERFEQRGLAYCVARNFDSVFAEGASDVDLIACAADLPAMREACVLAAQESGFALVQVARFANYSWVFAHEDGVLVRIDIDTAVRWRWCHMLSAAEVLAARQRAERFFIPAPQHEAAILRAQIAWRGEVPERYARRLDELGASAKSARSSILFRALLRPASWLAAVRYLASDSARWVARSFNPPGLHFRIVAARDFDLQPLAEALAGLFPLGKRSVFAGGMLAKIERVDSDAALAPAAAHAVPRSFARRSFVAVIQTAGVTHVAHVGTGSMAVLDSPAALARFVLRVLAALHAAPTCHAGRCIALAGLDGAGKTTFARTLCADAGPHFTGVRYFHWIPRPFRRAEFPWPTFTDLPRREAVPSGSLAAALSGLRLLRNVVLARLGFLLVVRPLVRRGWLVIIDRYVTNYWLDPASVRYAGPARWLGWARRLFPKVGSLVTLSADAATLRSRKGELSTEQIAAQSERLEQLPALADERLDLDAARPVQALVEEAIVHLARP